MSGNSVSRVSSVIQSLRAVFINDADSSLISARSETTDTGQGCRVLSAESLFATIRNSQAEIVTGRVAAEVIRDPRHAVAGVRKGMLGVRQQRCASGPTRRASWR